MQGGQEFYTFSADPMYMAYVYNKEGALVKVEKVAKE